MSLFSRLFSRQPNLTKLLSVDIVCDEDFAFNVAFTKHHPDLREPEYVRLLFHYYAKMMFNFDPSNEEMSESALVLRSLMGMIASQRLERSTPVLDIAELSDVASVVASSPTNNPRRIVATLFFVSAVRRHIATEVPENIYAEHAVYSVLVLLQAVLGEIGDECISVLSRGLTHMQGAYESGESFSDIENLSRIPNEAYVLAVG
jgi:hypothetical protein